MSFAKIKGYYGLFLFLIVILQTALGVVIYANIFGEFSDNPTRYLVGIYYYPWYDRQHWNIGFLRNKLNPPQLPALGLYNSRDINVIEKHIEWSAQYGIDFWAISYGEKAIRDDETIREYILKAKNINDIKFCIFYESGEILGWTEGKIRFDEKKKGKLISDFTRFSEVFFTHPSYLKIDGRPIVILYLTREYEGDYKGAITSLRNEMTKRGINIFLIADEVFWRPIKKERIALFDAITAYNIYEWPKKQHASYADQSTFFGDVFDLYKDYRNAAGKKVAFVPNIMPGYNDRGVRLREDHFVIPRIMNKDAPEGSFFEQSFKRLAFPLIDKKLNMIIITSWNEWHEDSQIEPVENSEATDKDISPSGSDYTGGYKYEAYGNTYLNVLRNSVLAAEGTIVNDKREPIAKASIGLIKKGKVMAKVSSNSVGHYSFSRLGLKPGIYELKISAKGFKPQTKRIVIAETKTIPIKVVDLQRETRP